MDRYARNLATVARRPTLAIEYLSWAVRKTLSKTGPTRSICEVRIGHFNGFSEFHSAPRAISQDELDFLRGHQFEQGSIMDVGANLGIFTLVVNRILPGRPIVAFEPAPSTFQALQSNVSDAQAANIECHRLAISEREGVAHFEMLEHARANSSLSASPWSLGNRGIEVPCTTLDRFAAIHEIASIALLKVDVEGFEAAVFRGGSTLLRERRARVIYFEICPRLAEAAGYRPSDAAEILARHGYSLHRISKRGCLEPSRVENIGQLALENWVALAP